MLISHIDLAIRIGKMHGQQSSRLDSQHDLVIQFSLNNKINDMPKCQNLLGISKLMEARKG